jgi:hypothetical protein
MLRGVRGFFHIGSDERGYFQAYHDVVANLIHQGRKYHNLVDRATKIMGQTGNGQFYISDDKIEELLSLCFTSQVLRDTRLRWS